jgi:formylglycine-generating enzyme required for sulfatase activity
MPTNPKRTTVSGENSGAGANAKRRQLSAETVWIERYGRQCGRVAGGLLEQELQRRSVSPVGSTSGSRSLRVLRCGSFDTQSAYLKSGARFRYDSDVRCFGKGFRVARKLA